MHFPITSLPIKALVLSASSQNYCNLATPPVGERVPHSRFETQGSDLRVGLPCLELTCCQYVSHESNYVLLSFISRLVIVQL